MRVGTKVSFKNLYPINSLIEGVVVKEKTAPNGQKSSKVCIDQGPAAWYSDDALKEMK